MAFRVTVCEARKGVCVSGGGIRVSVIPLVPGENIVETNQAFDDHGGMDGTAILIQGFDRQQLHDPRESNITYDLRIGQEYRDHRDQGKRDLTDDHYISLLPGAAVIVETEETIRLPKHVFGHIVPRVSWLQQGISNTSSKIDPGYHGKLLITLFNLGKRPVKLYRRTSICSVYFLQIGSGAIPYDKPAKTIRGDAGRHWLRAMMDYTQANAGSIAVLSMVVTIITKISEYFLQ